MSFVMLDKPLLRVIMWDLESFDAMRIGCEQAVRLGQDKFTVDLGRRYRRVEFATRYALDTIPQLHALFAANPMPKYPENREGAEP